MKEEIFDVAIIGGGITGLSSCYYLKQIAKKKDKQLKIALFEKDDRVGGKIASFVIENQQGKFLLEQGPDSFLRSKPAAVDLSLELGLSEQIIGTNDHNRKTWILKNNKPVLMPDGLMLMVPTKFWPFACSPLFSVKDKLRMLADIFIPAKTSNDDESVADFINRRLGKSALDYLAEPLMCGIYNSNPQKQSLLATFPQIAQLEKKYKSLIKGMLLAKKNNQYPAPKTCLPSSMFLSFKDGMKVLPETLADKLKNHIRYDYAIDKISVDAEKNYIISAKTQPTIKAKTIIFTSNILQLQKLLTNDLSSINFNKFTNNHSGAITLAYKKSDINNKLDSFGIVFPKIEKNFFNAVTISSSKLNYRAPSDFVLFRVFYGGARNPDALKASKEIIADKAHKLITDIFAAKKQPLFHQICEKHANPQYNINHSEEIKAIIKQLPQGLFVAGCSYLGSGIPDCITQGKNISSQVIDYISSSSE